MSTSAKMELINVIQRSVLVSTMKEVITVTAGSEINMKCSATGNTGGYSSWTWSWEWSIPTFYTELTGHTQASPTPTISNGVDG